MPLVCINRPSRSARRGWRPSAVSRVARYSAEDAGESFTTLAHVAHCLGFGPAICCAGGAIGGISDARSGLLQVLALQTAVELAIARALRLPAWVRILLRRVLAVLRIVLDTLNLLKELLDLVSECPQHRDDLIALCQQINILEQADLTLSEVCHGPE